MASISYNAASSPVDYAPEQKSAKLSNEIESADSAEQRSDVAPAYQVHKVICNILQLTRDLLCTVYYSFYHRCSPAL